MAFEEPRSEGDSFSSMGMEDDLLPEEEYEKPHDGVDLSRSATSELSRSDTKYFDAGETSICTLLDSVIASCHHSCRVQPRALCRTGRAVSLDRSP